MSDSSDDEILARVAEMLDDCKSLNFVMVGDIIDFCLDIQQLVKR